MPPRFEDPALDDLRDAAHGEDDGCFVSRALYRDLAGAYEFRSALDACAGRDWFKFHNPVLRCTVLRKRSMLEEKGLLVRVGARLHPLGTDADAGREYGYHFNGLALPTQPSFDEAYAAAEEFCASAGGAHAVRGIYEITAVEAHLFQLRGRAFYCGKIAGPRLHARGFAAEGAG